MTTIMHPDRAPVPDRAAPAAPEVTTPAPAAARTAAIPDVAAVITKQQLAGLVQVDLRTVERWESANRIPGRVRLPGRSVRFLRDVVAQWILEGCPRPEPPRKAGR